MVNPATEEVVATVPMAGPAEADAADRPRPRRPSRAGARWRPPTAPGCCGPSPPRSTPTARTWRRLEVANAGHTLGNARWEAGNVRDVLEYYAAAPERDFGRQIPVAGGLDVTFREPLGVVGVIVPWNFPHADRRLGAWPPRSPRATPWCSSPRSSPR